MALDAHTLDLEELRYGLSNVTCLRIFDPEDSITKSYLADWRASSTSNIAIPQQPNQITVSLNNLLYMETFVRVYFNFHNQIM